MSKIGIILFILIFGTAAIFIMNDYKKASHPDVVAREAFDLINKDRAMLNRPALVWDDDLEFRAVCWSEYMKETGDFRHSSMPYNECILKSPGHLPDGEDVFTPWVNSSLHYAVLISEEIQRGAIGISGRYATFLAR